MKIITTSSLKLKNSGGLLEVRSIDINSGEESLHSSDNRKIVFDPEILLDSIIANEDGSVTLIFAGQGFIPVKD